MDSLLEKALATAKIKNLKDPDRKAKEMFIRLFKNDEFRDKFKEWKDIALIKNEIRSYKELEQYLLQYSWRYESFLRGFLSWKKKVINLPKLPNSTYTFLSPAIFQFSLFETIKDWPVFGCSIEIKDGDNHLEPLIIFEPGVSQEDATSFIRKHWKFIKTCIDTYPDEIKINRIKPRKNPR